MTLKNNDSEYVLELNDVWKIYEMGEVKVPALKGVSLKIKKGDFVSIIGASVLEKTKEIGIMKAIGATNHDIMIIFLLNSGIIGLIGGLIGTILGWILSLFLPALMGSGNGGILSRMGSAGTLIDINTIIITLIFSIIIGMVAGAIPAYQASKLKPVNALHYE